MSSPYDGIDRSVDKTFSLRDTRRASLNEELIREGMRQLSESASKSRPTLLPAGLYEIVKKHGWGEEALRWFKENR